MKLLLKMRLCPPLGAALVSDPALARALGAKPNGAVGHVFGKWFDANGPVLPRVLDVAEAYGLGLLAYRPADLHGAPDFARTAEPWMAWDVPGWVVSQPVRQWVESQGLRGWAFSPVLAADSPAHVQHTHLWRHTQDRLSKARCEIMV